MDVHQGFTDRSTGLVRDSQNIVLSSSRGGGNVKMLKFAVFQEWKKLRFRQTYFNNLPHSSNVKYIVNSVKILF